MHSVRLGICPGATGAVLPDVGGERFHRVSTGLVHDVKGSGLGLSIVQHIVQAHGGKVAVESRVGEGSTFSLYLPIDPPAAASAGVLVTSEA